MDHADLIAARVEVQPDHKGENLGLFHVVLMAALNFHHRPHWAGFLQGDFMGEPGQLIKGMGFHALFLFHILYVPDEPGRYGAAVQLRGLFTGQAGKKLMGMGRDAAGQQTAFHRHDAVLCLLRPDFLSLGEGRNRGIRRFDLIAFSRRGIQHRRVGRPFDRAVRPVGGCLCLYRDGISLFIPQGGKLSAPERLTGPGMSECHRRLRLTPGRQPMQL